MPLYEKFLLAREQGWAIGVLALCIMVALSIMASLLASLGVQLIKNLIHLAKGDGREGELLLTPSHRGEASTEFTMYSSSLASSEASSLASAEHPRETKIDLDPTR